MTDTVTDEKLEEVYQKCLAVDEDGFDWLEELNEIASADAKDDGDYNFWDDIRERRDDGYHNLVRRCQFGGYRRRLPLIELVKGRILWGGAG